MPLMDVVEKNVGNIFRGKKILVQNVRATQSKTKATIVPYSSPPRWLNGGPTLLLGGLAVGPFGGIVKRIVKALPMLAMDPRAVA